MGMNGVYVRNNYTTYVGDELESMFAQRDMMIESSKAEIIIRMRKVGFEDKGRIQVFEDANGISFNSLSRTQIDFMEELADNGNPFTKIVIREPKGAMTRTARIYINLGLRHQDTPGQDLIPYNFILNTGASPVKFEYDPSVANMRINRLTVHGTGNVELPSSNEAFSLIVGELNVDSSNSSINCPSPITGAVAISGTSRNVTLDATGPVTVSGVSHRVTLGTVSGNVDFDAMTSSSLTIGKACYGNLTVNMPTSQISLNVREVVHLDVNAKGGSVSAGKVSGNSVILMDNGTVNLGTRGTDSGVFGDVDINKRTGSVSIAYANSPTAIGTCKIRTLDGNINVYGVRNAVDIYVPSSVANANVSVAFAAFMWNSSATSRIIIEGSRKPNTGNIEVKLLGLFPASFHFRGASEIVDNITHRTTELGNCLNHDHKAADNPNGTLEDWQTNAGCNSFIEKVGIGGAVLNVKTQGRISLESGSY
jgi:hypothetical protein